jgi:hypothetical protein
MDGKSESLVQDEAIVEPATAAIVDEMHDLSNNIISVNNSVETNKLIKDPNEIKKIEFVLNIQEIPGKKIVETYLKDLTSRLDAIVQQKKYVQYNFKIITYANTDYAKMMGGGNNSTFPYNIFEGILDTISQKTTSYSDNVASYSSNDKIISSVPVSETTSSTNKGLFERLFSFVPFVKTQGVSSVDLSFTMPFELQNLIQEPLTYNDNYDGVTHILVTIYDKVDTFGYIGGLAQLESWIKKGIKV